MTLGLLTVPAKKKQPIMPDKHNPKHPTKFKMPLSTLDSIKELVRIDPLKRVGRIRSRNSRMVSAQVQECEGKECEEKTFSSSSAYLSRDSSSQGQGLEIPQVKLAIPSP